MTAFFSLLAAVYGLDLVTKGIVRARLPIGSEVPVLPVFSLTHVSNTGIAFGLFPDKNLLFILLSSFVVGFILYHGARLARTDPFTGYVLAAVAGGALGNLTDRLFFGQVTDFLDFYIGTHHWPAFNVADSAICVGAGLLLVRGLIHRPSESIRS